MNKDDKMYKSPHPIISSSVWELIDDDAIQISVDMNDNLWKIGKRDMLIYKQNFSTAAWILIETHKSLSVSKISISEDLLYHINSDASLGSVQNSTPFKNWFS